MINLIIHSIRIDESHVVQKFQVQNFYIFEENIIYLYAAAAVNISTGIEYLQICYPFHWNWVLPVFF